MRKGVLLVSVFATIMALGAVGTASAATDHCSGHDDSAFNTFEGDGVFSIDGLVVTVSGSTVSFADENGDPVDVTFCVKASTGQSGEMTGSSFTVTWLNRGGQTPAISYVVVYGFEVCDPYYGCGESES